MKLLQRLRRTLRHALVELLRRFGLDALATCITELNKTRELLSAEAAMHLSQRQWNAELQRELEAREKAIKDLKAQQHDPLAEAQKLLRLIDDMLVPMWCGSGTALNVYEFKSWRDDYIQYKINTGSYRWRDAQ